MESYIPALRYNLLTAFYDPLIRWTMREGAFKRALINQMGLQPGHQILDVGCGTGTLAIMIKTHKPEADVVGLDGDARILELAEAKAKKEKVVIAWNTGFSTALPFKDSSYDRIVSSLLFHHLTHADKITTLQEIHRVLMPGGEFHLADWGQPQNMLMRLGFGAVQILDGFETTDDNLRGKLPPMMEEEFGVVTQTACFATMFGTLMLYRAKKPVS